MIQKVEGINQYVVPWSAKVAALRSMVPGEPGEIAEPVSKKTAAI